MTDLVKLLAQFDSGRHLEEDTLAAGKIKKIFAEEPYAARHTLWIFNKSTTDDIRLMIADKKTGSGITIRKDSDRFFDYHLVAILQTEDPNLAILLGHCEWSSDVYLYNPSANPVDYEAMEVF